MPEYSALVYAAGTVSAEVSREHSDEEIADAVDTGELPEPNVSPAVDGRSRVETSRWFHTTDYDGEFDSKAEFRACLKNSIDTGDLCDPKVRQLHPIIKEEIA